MNLPVRIFARSIKRLMAKRSETTRAMQQCLRGNFKEMVSLRSYIANSCISKRCTWRNGAINDYPFCHSERSRGIPVRKPSVPPRDPSTPLRSAQDDREPMNFKLKIWRQRDAKSRGKLAKYDVRDISPDTSFLEMLDILNENLIRSGGEPVAFDSDCREGICGTCSLTV